MGEPTERRRGAAAGRGGSRALARDRGGIGLNDSLTRLPGVGPARASDLSALGVEAAADLLSLWPRRHVDRTALTPIAGLRPGLEATVVATVSRARLDPRPGRAGPVLHVEVTDGGARLALTFFHATYLARVFKPGQRVLLSGTAEWRGRQLAMTHPEWEALEPDEGAPTGMVPVYPLSGSLKQRWMRDFMRRHVPALAAQAPDPLPAGLRARLDLPERAWAVTRMHFPADGRERERARRRLVFEEFFRIALAVQWLHGPGSQPGQAQRPDGPLARRFLEGLPFALTPGQVAAWSGIAADLAAPRPMARLLQGEVGSGKTVLAALALLAAVDAGRQAALMAPTEILAEQQAAVLERWFGPLGLEVGLLVGNDRAADAVRTGAEEGRLQLVVGTQALISRGVRFQDLGVVVIDEQHRFGVRQRAYLTGKGFAPDLLVMTATPIPRTLALTVYGDLALSRIEGLPPGRTPITTQALTRAQRRVAYQKVAEEVRRGRQAYVVCPLVQESPQLPGRGAVELARGMAAVPGWRVGLLHGQMPRAEREAVMERFRNGAIDVLVSTTIVEVGVDVPNATVMVVESADRFGLAQLHQLRGRVGRGREPGYCFLIQESTSEEAEARIAAMVRSQDGLALAEEDLRIRGPGEVLGVRQHGMKAFQLADPLTDLDILQQARAEARALLEQDPGLADPQLDAVRRWVAEALGEERPASVLH